MILLTWQERQRFALYLIQEAESDNAIAKQMEALPGTQAVARKVRMEAAAATIIANKLQSTEDEVVSR